MTDRDAALAGLLRVTPGLQGAVRQVLAELQIGAEQRHRIVVPILDATLAVLRLQVAERIERALNAAIVAAHRRALIGDALGMGQDAFWRVLSEQEER